MSYFVNQCVFLYQSLGVCVCTDSWAGSDCSVPRDSNNLVWETLLDTQLTVVRAEHNANTSKQKFQFISRSLSSLLFHRTRPTGSSTGWATLWCLDHRDTSGCTEASLWLREFWEMSTGKGMLHFRHLYIVCSIFIGKTNVF